MSERDLEQRFVRGVKRAGGGCFKWVSPGNAGVPDRIVVIDGRVIFVELKTEHGRLSILQKAQIRKLQQHGVNVKVLYGQAEVDAFVAEMKGGEV